MSQRPSQDKEALPEDRNRLHLDALLLSIIRAYPHHSGQSEYQRLSAAREALFGDRKKTGRTPIEDYHAIFSVIDETDPPKFNIVKHPEDQMDSAAAAVPTSIPRKRMPLSAREASMKNAKQLESAQSLDSAADRLRRKAAKFDTPAGRQMLANLLMPEFGRSRTAISILKDLEYLGVSHKSFWDKSE